MNAATTLPIGRVGTFRRVDDINEFNGRRSGGVRACARRGRNEAYIDGRVVGVVSGRNEVGRGIDLSTVVT